MNKHMIVVTGATGQLGRLVIANLLKRVPATQIVAAARTPSKAADLAALGVQVREADYGKPATLAAAFAGATSILLISSPALPAEGVRSSEHKAVIDAAFSYAKELDRNGMLRCIAPQDSRRNCDQVGVMRLHQLRPLESLLQVSFLRGCE